MDFASQKAFYLIGAVITVGDFEFLLAIVPESKSSLRTGFLVVWFFYEIRIPSISQGAKLKLGDEKGSMLTINKKATLQKVA